MSKRTEAMVLAAVAVGVAILSIVFDWHGWLKWGLFLLAMAVTTSLVVGRERPGRERRTEHRTISEGQLR